MASLTKLNLTLRYLFILYCLLALSACNPVAPKLESEFDPGFSPGFTEPEVVAIGALPVVALTSLTGGEVLEGNATYAITWTATDIEGFGLTPIKIYTSSNGGTTWVLLSNNEDNDGTYSWTTPAGTTSSTYRVRVTATDSNGNTSESSSASNLKIDSSAPTINLGSLTGGEFLKGNTAYNITWTASDTIGLAVTPITLEYSTDSVPHGIISLQMN